MRHALWFAGHYFPWRNPVLPLWLALVLLGVICGTIDSDYKVGSDGYCKRVWSGLLDWILTKTSRVRLFELFI